MESGSRDGIASQGHQHPGSHHAQQERRPAMYRVHERHTASPGIEMLPAAPVVEVHPGGGHRRGIQLGTRRLFGLSREMSDNKKEQSNNMGFSPCPAFVWSHPSTCTPSGSEKANRPSVSACKYRNMDCRCLGVSCSLLACAALSMICCSRHHDHLIRL